MEVSGRRQAGSEESQRECDICVRSCSVSRAVYGYCVDCRDYLCRDCYHAHKGHKASVNHKLLEGDRVPKVKLCPVDICQTHPDEKILYFCKGHSALACQKCVILQHRMCAEVNDIATVSRDPNYVKQSDETRKHVDKLEAKIDKHRQARVENLSKIDANKAMIKSDIKNFSKRLHDHLHKMEQKMLEKANEIGQENTSNMDTILQECDTLSADLDIIVNDLETNQDPDRRDQLFIAVQKAAAVIKLLQDKVTILSNTNTVCEYSFTLNEGLSLVINDVNSLGDLSRCDDDRRFGDLSVQGDSQRPSSQLSNVGLTPRWNYDNVTVHSNDVINVRIQSDKVVCCITGSAMLEGDITLAVADYTNNSVKLVDITQRKVVSQIRLSSGPWDITHIQPDQLAVTLPWAGNLQILFVNGTSLSLEREIMVSPGCRGIVHHNGRLFISCIGTPPQIQILSMSGSVLNTISRQTDGQFPCLYPHYLTLSVGQSSLFVTDWSTNSFFCLDMDGKVKTTFKNQSLNVPYGLTVAENGTVIVCGGGSNNLFMVSLDERRGNTLIDESRGVQHPTSVTYSSTLSTLYVGEYKSDTLKVFRLK